MATKSVLSRWISEYCAPVVVIVASPEAEKISLKNGLLIHDLLSAFGHIDAVSATIRAGGNNIPVRDGHIRFENVAELLPKSSAVVEETCSNYFEPYDLAALPATSDELKALPPSSQTPLLESVLIRSASFQDFDMVSHPISILTIVASSDINPVGLMQQLVMTHHSIPGISQGLYEPEIQRLYVLLHDIGDCADKPVDDIYRQLQIMYPYHARELRINSLTAENANLQQPDWWGRWMLPKFYLGEIASSMESPTLMNPETGRPVLGSRLSMEDFMRMQAFCTDLFNRDLIPAIERRMTLLHRLVNDTKKGMRNMLKNLWRKPREETPPNSPLRPGGGAAVPLIVRYKFDRPEAQTLYLADLSFILKDYETALSMYRLVRDDFKADKSTLHHAYVTLMMAACLLLDQSSKNSIKDIHHQLENLAQIVTTSAVEPGFMHAYFALLIADIYAMSRAPVEAVQALLFASNVLSRSMPLLSALLTEKTSQYILLAGQHRGLGFNQVLTAQKFLLVGGKAAKHATVCFATAAILFEENPWGDARVNILKALINEFRRGDRESSKRCLLLLLQCMDASVTTELRTRSQSASNSAYLILQEILNGSEDWHSSLGIDSLHTSHILVDADWRDCSVRKVLVGDVPITLRERSAQEILADSERLPQSFIEVSNLKVPFVDAQTAALLSPLNGNSVVVADSHGASMKSMASHSKEIGDFQNFGVISCANTVDVVFSEYLKTVLIEEKSWAAYQVIIADQATHTDASSPSLDNKSSIPQTTLGEHIANIEYELDAGLHAGGKSRQVQDIRSVPLGENVLVKVELTNPLPVSITVENLSLELESVNPCESMAFSPKYVSLKVAPGQSTTLILSAAPKCEGIFKISSATWTLNESSIAVGGKLSTSRGPTLLVKSSLQQRGKLLQKTVQQRAGRLRGQETYMEIQVTPPQPLLHVSLDLDQESSDAFFLIQGQFQFGSLIIKNEGGASASNLDAKLSSPFMIVEDDEPAEGETGKVKAFMWPITASGTSLEFPRGIVIEPGQTRRFRVCVRLENSGKHTVSLLLAYRRDSSEDIRSSFASFQFFVFASLVLSARTAPRSTDPLKRVLILDMKNYLESDESLKELGIGNIDDPMFGRLENFYTLEGVHDEVLEECSIRIESVSVIGALREEIGSVPIVTQRSIRSSEKLSVLLPSVLSTTVVNGSSSRLHPYVWHAVSETGIPKASAPVSQSNYVSMSDVQVLSRHYASLVIMDKRYQAELQEARNMKKIEALEAEETGPRTISQVRRDRKKDNFQAEEGADDLSFNLDLGKNWIPRNYEDLAKKEVYETSSIVSNRSSQTLGSSALGGACIVVTWVARFGGFTRRGMQILHDVPILSSTPSTVSSRSSSTLPDGKLLRKAKVSPESAQDLASIENRISVTANYLSKVVMDPMRKSCLVDVTISILSSYSSIVRLTVETVDRMSSVPSSDDSKAPSTFANKSSQSSKGITWLGKCKYSNINLRPFSNVELKFTASISKYGIVDLKRFKVTIDTETQSGELCSIVKDVPGNYLVEVVDRINCDQNEPVLSSVSNA